MPVADNGPVAKKRRLKPKAKVSGPAPGQTGGGSGPRPAPSAPTGDTKSSADLGRAKTFKKTAPYRGAIKAAYNESSPAQRRQRLAGAQARGRRGQASAEDVVVTKLHNERTTSTKRQAVVAKKVDAVTRASQMGLSGTRQKPVATPHDTGAGKDTKSNTDLKVGGDILRHEGWARTDKLDKERTKALKVKSLKHKQLSSDVYLKDPAALKAAGFKTEGTADKIAKLPGRVIPTLAASAYQTGKATYEDPTKVIPKTLEGGAKMAASFAVAPVHYTLHPKDITKLPGQVVKDTERRYKDVIKHPEKFRKRIKKEGAASELVDIASVAGPVGAVAGRGANTVARAGAFGKVAKRISTVRPDVQVTGGRAAAQAVHPNFVRNTGRAATDTLRRKVQQHRAKHTDAQGHASAPLEVREAERKSGGDVAGAKEALGHAVHKEREAHKAWEDAGKPAEGPTAERKIAAGEERRQADNVHHAASQGKATPTVTYIRRGATKRAQRKMVAQDKGVRMARMKAEQQREVGEARKNVGKLDKHEKRTLKYVMQYGIRDVETGVADLKAHRARIVAERAKDPALRLAKKDELKHIDAILANPDKHLTPRVMKTAEVEGQRSRRVAASDPGLTEEQAALRRANVQAELHGVTREQIDTKASFKKVKAAHQEKKAAQREYEAALAEHGNARGRAAVLSRQVGGSKAEHRSEARTVPGEGGGGKIVRSDQAHFTPGKRDVPGKGWVDDAGTVHTWPEDGPSHAQYIGHKTGDPLSAPTAKNTFLIRPDGTIKLNATHANKFGSEENLVRHILQQDDRLHHPTIKRESAVPATQHAGGGRGVEQATERLQKATARREAANKALADAGKTHRVGVARKKAGHTGESNESYLARAEAARGHRAEGEYFPSVKREEGVFSSHTVGGTGATPKDKRFKGSLTRTGREQVDPQVHVTGVAKNIKRKHNWDLVSENFEKHTVPWSRGKTVSELKDQLEERGISEDSVSFWNPELFREERGSVHAEDIHGQSVDQFDPEFSASDVAGAMERTTLPGNISRNHKAPPGWAIIPRQVHDEIHSSVNAGAGEGKVARGWDIAKGKASRAILANPAWAGFQIASNALMSSIAGAGPMSLIKGQRAFRKLAPEQKDALEAMAGIVPWHNEERHLGATAGQLAHAYHALRSLPILKYRPVKSVIDAFFRFDNAQNNFFRRAVFYNKAQQQVYKDMAANGGKAHALQGRIANTFKLPPDEQLSALLKDPALLEKHAQAVDDFLGNWTSYTARERRILGRSVMFYGFLRFSTRLALYTLPVKHPITASIMLKLGDLEYQEQKRIFGGDPPVWEIGNFYGKDGKKQFDAKRLNPLFNAMGYLASTSEDPDKLALNLASIAGMLPPAAQVALNQIAGKNVAFQQNYTVNGKTEEKRKGGDIGWGDKLQIVATELLNSSAYYRALAKSGAKVGPVNIKPLRGKQSSDSSLLKPSPTKYSDKPQARKARERNAERIKSENRNSKNFGETLIEPFRPEREAETVKRAKYYRAQKTAGPKAKKPKSLFDQGKLKRQSLFDAPATGTEKSLFDQP